jgi:glycine cleavage system regulatory protein
MHNTLVLTLIGQDRPGIVESLSSAIAACGGNWTDGHMSHLAGHFAGILRIDIAAAREGDLMEGLRSLEKQGLQILVHASDSVALEPLGELISITVVGQDRPGIVRDLSTVLKRLNINVEELQSGCLVAPHSGEALFQAKMRVRMPLMLTEDQLKSELNAVSQDFMVDIVRLDTE